jgi:membrane associated rhomboid family serine protease
MGVVTSTPATLLRLEGACLLGASGLLYAASGASWWLFAALFLVPDLTMLGYLRDPKLGAALYNAGHSTVAPILVCALGWLLLSAMATAIGLIWLAHIGFDRLMGYGLKYPDAFRHTHLGGGIDHAR